jgi:ABC-type multidrug transport system ATPase subunit
MVADPFIIETADLRKAYDGVAALRGLSLEVPAGSIYGCVWKNGAGKTTTRAQHVSVRRRRRVLQWLELFASTIVSAAEIDP